MAFALDANLGTRADGSSGGTSRVLTTTAAAASNTLIVAFCFVWDPAASTLTVSGGGLSWATDVKAGTDNDQVWIASAYAESGLASETDITFSFGATNVDWMMASMASFSGSSERSLDTTGTNSQATVANWSTAARSNAQADALYVAACGSEGDGTFTNSATTGTEIHDFGMDPADQELATQYLVVDSIASRSLAGTWSATTDLALSAVAIFTLVALTQELRPDADTTTTGWTDTPLWSKVNDQADATLITATLG